MRINTNVPSLAAYRNHLINNSRYLESIEKVITGLSINSAADDAAGLAISTRMRNQIVGLNQAVKNASSGIALIQTAEGALSETHSIMQRMRELSVQAASDTLTAADRAAIQKEIDQLTAEIDRIATTTEFNQKKLLNGTTSALVSTDNLQTKVFVRDGLQVTDQFGQKVVAGGNFRLEIEADPGEGQVLKTDIMKSNRETFGVNYVPVDGAAGLQAALQEYPGLGGLRIVIEDPEGVPNQPLRVYPEAEVGFETGDDGMVWVIVRPATDDGGNITTTVEELSEALNEAQIQSGLGAGNAVQILLFNDQPDGGEPGGHFMLSYDGVNSGWIRVGENPNETAGSIQAALGGIPAIGEGNIEVSWVPAEEYFRIEFVNGMSGREVETLQFVDGIAGSVSANVRFSGPMVQQLVFTSENHNQADTFTLEFIDLPSTELITVENTLEATSANIKDALVTAIDKTGIEITVTGNEPGDGYTYYTITLEAAHSSGLRASEINEIGPITFGAVENGGSEYQVQSYNWWLGGGMEGDEYYSAVLISPQGSETIYDGSYQGTAGEKFTMYVWHKITNVWYQTGNIEFGASGNETALRMEQALDELLLRWNDWPFEGYNTNDVEVKWYDLEDYDSVEDAVADGLRYWNSYLMNYYGATSMYQVYLPGFSNFDQIKEIGALPPVADAAGEYATSVLAYAADAGYQLLELGDVAPSGTIILSYNGTETISIPIGSDSEENRAQIEGALNEAFDSDGNNIRVYHFINHNDGTGIYALDFSGSDFTPTDELIKGDGIDFTGGDGQPEVISAGSSGPDLDQFLTFQLTGGGGNLLEAGITLLTDPFATLPPGSLADRETTLDSIDRFYDASGNFYLEQPQTITLFQGDGRRAEVTLFGTDSIADVEAKLNEAIHEGLGQKEYTGGLGGAVDPETGKAEIPAYIRFVAEGEADPEGLFSVAGTFVIQSAIAGSAGELTFGGDDRVLEALSLTTIRAAKESVFTINISDAHSGETIACNVKAAGNLLIGAVHSSVDVAFDPMANTAVTAEGEAFAWSRENSTYSTYIHLADNSMVFHIGANPLQDIRASIGDMSSEALGINSLSVGNRSAANRSIGRIDEGISRVSAERAKIGAIQNRLEHTINSLGVASENLTAAESRIRDVDLALEIGKLTRNQLLNQAGTAIMAQANMRPQTILSLIA